MRRAMRGSAVEVMGMVLLFGGVGLKVSVVGLEMWRGDRYEGGGRNVWG